MCGRRYAARVCSGQGIIEGPLAHSVAVTRIEIGEEIADRARNCRIYYAAHAGPSTICGKTEAARMAPARGADHSGRRARQETLKMVQRERLNIVARKKLKSV